MLIRTEARTDRESIRAVNLSAFETASEADLVDALLEQATPTVSLVADDNGDVIGHIMFSPVSLTGWANLTLMGLAPMAVAPNHQRKDIGSALIRAGLEQCKKLDIDAVVVLGYPEYYSRFGFSTSSEFGIDTEYDVPKEVFMAIELKPEALRGRTGTVKYHAAFGDV